MKNVLQAAVVVSLIIATSCNNAPKADEAVTTEEKAVSKEDPLGAEYNVDVQKSNIKWIGTKPTGSHNGTFMLKEGKLNAAGNNIQGGHFTIDMATLAAYDDDGKANEKLDGHLEGEDFFDVSKFGTATFEITNAQPGIQLGKKELILQDATHTITGNLKMKGVTKSISFPAKVALEQNSIIADAEFNIDRTEWGLNYGSDKSLGNKFIRPDVNIKIHLEARK